MNAFLNAAVPFLLTYFWVLIPVAMIAAIVIAYRSDEVTASDDSDSFLFENPGPVLRENWLDAHACGTAYFDPMAESFDRSIFDDR